MIRASVPVAPAGRDVGGTDVALGVAIEIFANQGRVVAIGLEPGGQGGLLTVGVIKRAKPPSGP